MANTVNLVAAIATDADREFTGISCSNFKGGYTGGEALRATLSIDTNAAFVIDDPHLISATSNRRLYVIGCNYACLTAATVQFQSKVDAVSAIVADTFPLVAGGGILSPTRGDQIVTHSRRGGKLQVLTTGAAGGNVIVMTITYIFADYVIL